MSTTRLLCALGLSFTSIAAGGQTSAPVLPETVRAHVKDARLQAVTSLRGLPLGVRDALSTMFGGPYLDIAEPGAPYRTTDVVFELKLPVRRLVTAACSTDHCVVYYERGGIAHTWHVAIFHWTPAETRFEWGGSAPGGLQGIDAIRNAILSGAIKGSSKYW
jgi:hypothetical protein